MHGQGGHQTALGYTTGTGAAREKAAGLMAVEVTSTKHSNRSTWSSGNINKGGKKKSNSVKESEIFVQ